ncbi:uncharacterized protein WM277_005014 [Molossus nigricans]
MGYVYHPDCVIVSRMYLLSHPDGTVPCTGVECSAVSRLAIRRPRSQAWPLSRPSGGPLDRQSRDGVGKTVLKKGQGLGTPGVAEPQELAVVVRAEPGGAPALLGAPGAVHPQIPGLVPASASADRAEPGTGLRRLWARLLLRVQRAHLETTGLGAGDEEENTAVLPGKAGADHREKEDDLQDRQGFEVGSPRKPSVL